MTGRKKKDNVHPSSETLKATSGSNQLKQQFKPGDTTWIKIHANSWWPAQVVDEKTVGNKPKKRAEDEILVRQYGTSEYLYVDPWKSSSEFEHFLKQENCNAREAFQKSLEKDILLMKSAGKSKRKISKENSTVEDPKCKKQKQDKTQRSREAVGLASPGDSKIKVAKQYYLRQPKFNNVGKLVKENVKGEAFKDKGEEQGKVWKNMMRKEKSGTFKLKNRNQDSSRQMKLTLVVRDDSSKEKHMKQGDARSPEVKQKVTDKISKTKNTRQYIFRNRKHTDVGKPVTEKVENRLSKDKKMGHSKRGWQDVSQKSVSGGSKVKMMKQDCLKELKHKYDREERLEKDGDKISRHKKIKQVAEGRSSVKEKATDRVSEVKNIKQNKTRLTKHDDVKEHNIESPGSTKHGTPKETGDLSARRTRVMQSLGLIAPLGSPFRRNGLVEAAVLKL